MTARSRRALEIAALAMAYFLLGRAALLLAMPPGYASPFWPAAGLALVALLVRGEGLWPGVFLGQFLVNTANRWNDPGGAFSESLFALSAAMGIGAALQALVGSRLVRRAVGCRIALEASGEIARLVLVGCVSCLVSASCGVAALVITRTIPLSNAFFSWATWWAGDALGVIIVTPAGLLATAPSEAVSRARRIAVLLPLLVMIICVVAVYAGANVDERRSVEDKFKGNANMLFCTLQRHFDGYMDALEAVGSFMNAAGAVGPEEFRAFTGRILESHRGMQAISWNALVRGEERVRFEESVREQGVGEFRITESDTARRAIAAGPRPEYVAVTFIEPVRGNERAVGFDVASDPIRRAALERARDEARPVATARITLIQEKESQPGIIVFLPVFERGQTPVTAEERRQRLRGYVVGVFRIGDMTRAALSGVALEGISLRLADLGGAREEILYEQSEAPWESGRVRRTRTFEMAGRPWAITMNASPGYLAAHRSLQPWMVIGACLLTTGLMESLLLVATGGAAGIEASERRYRGLFFDTPIAIWEEDFSAVHRRLNELRAGGVEDVPGYIEGHPEEVARCAELVRIIDVNRAALGLFEAKRGEDLFGSLARLLEDPARDFRSELIAFASGLVRFEVATHARTLEGDRRNILIRWTVSPGRERTLDRIIVSMLDVTVQKRAADALESKTDQLQAVSRIMTLFLEDGDWKSAGARILASALKLTGSEYGFIGVLAEGGVLRVIAHEGVRWSEDVNRAFYESALTSYREKGYLEFTNFDNLFGCVLRTGAPIMANDAPNDPRSGGLPAGHPPLSSFLGVPLRRGAEIVGLIGVANRPGGYDRKESEKIEVIARIAGLIYDLHRRREHEAALEVQIRRSQRMESIGILAAGVAHEINNPLTYVLMNLETLLAEHLGDAGRPLPPGRIEEMRAHVADAVDGARRVREIVRDLKTFARDAGGRAGPADVERAVENAIRITTNEIRFRARLLRDFAAVPPVIADEDRLTQVFLNLLINAAQAVPPGDTDGNEIRVRTRCAGDEVVVEISDTGHGMPPEVLEHVFDPFFTTKNVGEGTGLGLSICYNTITSFGGRIEATSEPGRGSQFAVRLPVAVEQAREASRGDGAMPHAAGRRRVLVVDDEASIRRVIARALGREHEIVTAGDGVEALNLLSRDRSFDVILCDLMMPRMDGAEFYEEVRTRYPHLERRFIFMSGGAFTSAAQVFLEQSGRPHVGKPFTTDDVLRAIGRVTDENESAAAAAL